MARRTLFGVTLLAFLRKEILSIIRTPIALIIVLGFPVLDILLFGYVIDIKPKQINTVVCDLSNSAESRRLIERFVSSNNFRVSKWVFSDQEISDTIIRGDAKIGIKIPVDYTRKLINGDTASILIILDNSNSIIAGQVASSANRIVLQESLNSLLTDAQLKIPQETRNVILFNPDVSSFNFFLPGLIVWELPAITLILLMLSIALEKETGTLDQLRLTPANTAGMLVGRMLPYALLALSIEVLMIIVGCFMFKMPFNGSFILLIALSIPFILTDIGIGFIFAVNANTQHEAVEIATPFRVLLPFYFSGYIFPIETMSTFCQYFSYVIPHRHAVDIIRSIILRGAGIQELWPQALILCSMSIFVFIVATALYRKKMV